jgi:hypothetical protein
MMMQSLAVTGQIQAGFGLLAQVEASWSALSHFDDNCYPIFRTLLGACHLVGDSNGASRV